MIYALIMYDITKSRSKFTISTAFDSDQAFKYAYKVALSNPRSAATDH